MKVTYKTVFPQGDKLDEDLACRRILDVSYCCEKASEYYGSHVKMSRLGPAFLYVECRYDVEGGPPEYDQARINFCPFCGRPVELVERGRFKETLVLWPATFSKVEEVPL